MSALGDYIHLTAVGYKKYGDARPGQQASFTSYMSARDFIQKKVNTTISKITEAEIKTLENRLAANSKDSNDMNKEIEQRVIEYNEVILKLISSGLLDWNQGMGRFQNLLQSDENKFSFPIEQYNELKKAWQDAKALRDRIEALIDKINNTQQPQPVSLLKDLKNEYQRYVQLNPYANKNASTLKEIKKAMTDSLFSSVYEHIAGRWGEMVVATCSDVVHNKAISTADQAILFFQNSVQGDIKSAINIPKTDIAVPVSMTTSDANQNFYTITPTKDKVDVVIKVNQKDILATVKAYRHKDPSEAAVHLQTLNLFYTISFLNQSLKNFGNHWLNLHVAHEKIALRKEKEKTVLDELVAKEVAFQALSHGNPYKDTKDANVFVYINRFNGNILIESVEQLLLTNKINRLGNIQSRIAQIHFENKRANSWQERISNVLAQLHAKKIDIRYRPYSLAQ